MKAFLEKGSLETKIRIFVLACTLFLVPVGTMIAQGSAEKVPEKEDLVLIINSPEDKWMDPFMENLQEQFPEYNLIFKDWISATAERDIKILISSNNPPDIVMYWPNYMATFVNSGMALDLTPYLEENDNAWLNTFSANAQDIGKYDGKYYNIAYSPVYPVIIANKDLLDQAGVRISDPSHITWDEFLTICKQLSDNLGDVFPMVQQNDNACHFSRNLMLMAWDDRAELAAFNAGEISFKDPRLIEGLDEITYFFEHFAYPGPGSLSVKFDEAISAFQQNRVAMVGTVNTLASGIIQDTGIENPLILSWPQMGPVDVLLGGSDGWFIPSNSKHKEAAVEVLKYMSSPESLQIGVDGGKPVTVKDVESDDPNFNLYSRDTYRITDNEVINLSSEIFDILVNKMPAEYIMNGMPVINQLENYRLEVLASK